MVEEWKDVVGYEKCYQISSWGRIKRTGNYRNQYKSWVSNKILTLKTHTNGYKTIILSKNNNKATKYVHRLVAIAFIENPNSYEEINHKDGDKTNNNINNLEWCNKSMNTKHAYDNNLRKITGNVITGRKRVAQISCLTSEVLKIHDSIGDAARYILGSSTSISNICNGKNGRKKLDIYKGCRWMFIANNMNIGDIVNDSSSSS